ncbi:MAG: peptide ligase PGM1-related protein [Pyrinomonadaceae bacterium]
MTTNLPAPDLGLSPEEAEAQFQLLQKKLLPLWKSIQSFNQDEQTIVVVPSISIETAFSGSELQAYEERFLFLLLLLRQPRARLVYVTSQMIQPNIIDYYLDLLPGVISSHARKRLFLVTPSDASHRPLSLKLLERPHLLRQIRALIIDPERAHLVPYNTTLLERDLALRLGIPMFGADPKHFPLGTKSGCRRIFSEEGVPHPVGVENLSNIDEAVSALAGMRARKPRLSQAIIKLNEGVSGEGNALVDLSGLPAPGGESERELIHDRLRAMRFELAGVTYDWYVEKLNERGGVVEERITGDELRSPSAQLRVTPLGKVELLSTHDQVLGGPSGQSYLGCRFPADPGYASAIMSEAAKVGARLAREGVIGRFAVDFVVVRSQGGTWEPHAIEINLRKGGTTHPFLTLQFLTDGSYDAEKGVFVTARGQQKCFVASDHQESPLYRAFTPDDLFDVVARRGIHFDQTRQTGVVFHMMTALGDCGRVGLTAVGDTQAEADEIYAKPVRVLDEEARLALNLPNPS